MYKKLFIKFMMIFFLLNILGAKEVMADSDNLNFSMNIVQPDNQYDKSVTYFDILVKPGKKQTLKINVTNTGNTEEKIRITPTNATTNSNGLLDYSIQPKDYKYDKTLKIPFTTLVSKSQEVTVKSKETKAVSFEFKAPSQEFEGIILGGFLASSAEDNKESEVQKKGINFINKFQLVKAIIVRSSEEKIAPNIKLNKVQPALFNYQTAVTANIQNATPTLLKNVNIKAEITKKGTTKVLKSENKKNIEIAPNSNFDFPILWGNEPLKHGDYIINLSVITKEKIFKFDKEFNISKEASYNINSKAIDIVEEKNNTLLIVIITLLSIIVLSMLSYILYKNVYKAKKNNNHNKKKKKSSNKIKNTKH